MKINQDLAKELREILNEALAEASRQQDFNTRHFEPSETLKDALIISKRHLRAAQIGSFLLSLPVPIIIYFLIGYFSDNVFYEILVPSIVFALNYGCNILRYISSHYSENAYRLAKDRAWAYRYMNIYMRMLESIDKAFPGSTPDLSFSNSFDLTDRHEFLDRAINYKIPENEYPFVSGSAALEFATRNDKIKNKYYFNIHEDKEYLASIKADRTVHGKTEPPVVRK